MGQGGGVAETRGFVTGTPVAMGHWGRGGREGDDKRACGGRMVVRPSWVGASGWGGGFAASGVEKPPRGLAKLIWASFWATPRPPKPPKAQNSELVGSARSARSSPKTPKRGPSYEEPWVDDFKLGEPPVATAKTAKSDLAVLAVRQNRQNVSLRF